MGMTNCMNCQMNIANRSRLTAPAQSVVLGTHRSRNETGRGFTIVELMFVIGIIVALVAILVPALARARDQAKVAKCLANLKTTGGAVHSFAQEHFGYGQLSAFYYWKVVDAARKRYAYESATHWPEAPSQDGLVLSPWPIAYAEYLGAPGLTSERYFIKPHRSRGTNRRSSSGEEPLEPTGSDLNVLMCPGDRAPMANFFAPWLSLARASYFANADLFVHQDWAGIDSQEHRLWREGSISGQPIDGNLERVFAPQEVVLFVDGQHDWLEDRADPRSLDFVPPSGAHFYSGHIGTPQDVPGPDLGDWAGVGHGLPLTRHPKGGVSAAFVDGSARFLRPTIWDASPMTGRFHAHVGGPQLPMPNGRLKFAKRFDSKARISPYRPYPPKQMSGTTRRP